MENISTHGHVEPWCPICCPNERLDLCRENVIQTQCHHYFHRKCLLNWLLGCSTEPTFERVCLCPLCPYEVSENYILSAPGNGQALEPPSFPLRQLQDLLRFFRWLIYQMKTKRRMFLRIWMNTFLPIIILAYVYQATILIFGTEPNCKQFIQGVQLYGGLVTLPFYDLYEWTNTKPLFLKLCGYDAFIHIFIPESSQFLAYTYLDIVWYTLLWRISARLRESVHKFFFWCIFVCCALAVIPESRIVVKKIFNFLKRKYDL